MAPLASAFVRLRPQLSATEVRVEAERAGAQAGAAMGRSMSTGLSRTFKAAAGLGAATGLVEAGRKVLEFADQFEGARARVEQNTENIGTSFAAVQKPLGDLDTKMSGLGFTITDTENSFAQLVTATRDPAKSLRDVALAADIARGRHISLDAATQILMRVETGHVAMLGRLGIATRDASGHMFTQQQALDALGRAYGGNATRFAGTFAGKQAAARAEMQQAATEIGVALLPALSELASVVAHDVLPPIAALARFFDRNRASFEPLVKAGLELTLMWKGLGLATRATTAITGLFAPKAAAATVALEAETVAARTATTAATSLAVAMRALSVIGTVAIGVQFAHNVTTQGNQQTKQGLADLAASGPAGVAQVRAVQQQSAAILARGGPDFGGVTKHLHDWATAALSAVGADKKLADSAAAVGNATQDAATKIAASTQSLLATSSAQDALRQAMHSAAQTAVDNGRALRGNSDAALANRDAVRGMVSAALGVISTMKEQHRSAQAQADMLRILTGVIEANATKTYGDKKAVDALLHSLGLIPGEVQPAVSALSALTNARALDIATANKTELPGRDVKAPLGAAAFKEAFGDATKQAKDAKDAADKIAKSFMDGFSPTVDKAADKAAKAAESAFDKMKQKAADDLQTIRDAIDATRTSLEQFGSITNNLTTQDTLGASMTGNVFANRKREAAQLKQFATLYDRLSHLGLNREDLHAFMVAGPDAIPAMQQIISAGRAGVRQENRLERQINATAGHLATEDAASQNLGLIHRDLQKLAPAIARALAAQLQHLGIYVKPSELDRHNGNHVLTASR